MASQNKRTLCKSCGTDRFPIKQSLCGRCRTCINKIRKLKVATSADLKSLKGVFPFGGFVRVEPVDTDIEIIHGYGPDYWGTQFENDRAKWIKRYENRLEYLRAAERLYVGSREISEAEIVRLLRSLAKWAGVPLTRRILSTASAELAQHFTADQKLLIFRWLIQIVESTSRRWSAIEH